jgi:CDP-diacylglycerol--serine O-phosphatidyltransferase
VGAVILHAPVLKFDLLRPLRRPISNRLFGANKTWRGALVMFIGVLVATGLVWPLMPEELDSWLVTGVLIGAGTVLGELPNSFLKRRLGIAPGQRRVSPLGLALVVYDQADFVPAIALALLPVWVMPLDTLLLGFVAVAAVHFVVNVVGYAIGAREQPI